MSYEIIQTGGKWVARIQTSFMGKPVTRASAPFDTREQAEAWARTQEGRKETA